MPQSFTVMKLKVPRALAEEVGLHEPQLIGTARELPAIQPGDSPFERVLTLDKLDVFNDALINGQIDVQRLKVK